MGDLRFVKTQSILSNDHLLFLRVRVVPDVLLVGALEVAGLEVGGAGNPTGIRFKAKEGEDLLEAVLQGLPHVLVVDDQQLLWRVVLQPVGVEVEPGGRLDLHKLLPAASYKLIDLGQASVTSAEIRSQSELEFFTENRKGQLLLYKITCQGSCVQ